MQEKMSENTWIWLRSKSYLFHSLCQGLGVPGDATGNWGTYTGYVCYWLVHWISHFSWQTGDFSWSVQSELNTLWVVVGFESCTKKFRVQLFWLFCTFLKNSLFKVETPVGSILTSEVHCWSALLPVSALFCPSMFALFMCAVCSQNIILFRNRQRWGLQIPFNQITICKSILFFHNPVLFHW